MIYIKTYETVSKVGKKLYWLVPTDHRLESSLKELGCFKYFKINMEIRRKYKYIFISYIGTKLEIENAASRWGWNPYQGEITDDYYESYNYKFAGVVNISDYELESEKYNL